MFSDLRIFNQKLKPAFSIVWYNFLKKTYGGKCLSDIRIFKRTEKKYLLSYADATAFLDSIADKIIEDEYPHSTVTSLYLDTPTALLLRRSIEGGIYKEKLRLRWYGDITADGRVYLELKKKYMGTVYKRRCAVTLQGMQTYFEGGELFDDGQIAREFDHSMHYYNMPKPYLAVIYERDAYVLRETRSVRITIDRNVRYKNANESVLYGGFESADTKEILPTDTVIMEIKTDGAVPLWLSRTLGRFGILPNSFSKCGNAYQKELMSKRALLVKEKNSVYNA